MNLTCSVYIAASIDGFIAKPGGDIDWLHRPEYANATVKGVTYEEFISSVDMLVMGRNTFEKVLTFNNWPYQDTLVTVLTTKNLDIPDHLNEKIRVESGPPEQVIDSLSNDGYRHFYIDGGVTIQRFLQEKLIDELTITRIPVILGRGIPLFGHLDEEQHLEIIDVSVSDNGFVQERYRILKNTS